MNAGPSSTFEDVLKIIEAQPGLSANEIADRLGITYQMVNRAACVLESLPCIRIEHRDSRNRFYLYDNSGRHWGIFHAGMFILRRKYRVQAFVKSGGNWAVVFPQSGGLW